VHRFSTTPPYTQTSVNFKYMAIKYKEYFMVHSYVMVYSYLWCTVIYGVKLFIPVLRHRTLKFPEIRICETTDELDCVITVFHIL
jgi:hypothetical protein